MRVAAELKIKHGDLYECCVQHGGAAAFAEKCGLGRNIVYDWLHLRRCPVKGKYTKFYTEESERKVEELCGKPIDEVFPDELREFSRLQRPTKYIAITEMNPLALIEMDSRFRSRMTLESPDYAVHEADLKSAVSSIINTLTEREQKIYQMRFVDGMTLEEVGKSLRLTRGRVHMLEQRLIRKLQNPKFSSKLIGFIENDN